MKLKISTLVLTLVSISSFAFAGGSTSAGPAHPSSKYCIDRGGQGTIVDIDYFGGDQGGICRLTDDSVIETMTFWRQQQESTIAFAKFRAASWHTYEGLSIEKWAEKNCLELGGKIIAVSPHLRPSVKYQLCEFLDHSAIEIWTLMSGPSYYPELAK